MVRASRHLIAIALVLAPAVVLCQTRTPAAQPAVTLTLEPVEIRLDRPGATQQLVVLARSADGRVRDVTTRAKFASSDAAVATVSPSGEILPAKDGAVTVEAAFGGARVRRQAVIRNFAAPIAWSFASLITPVLTSGGCNQSSCHGSPVGKNGFKLSLFGYEPDLDYAALVTKEPGRRVNTRNIDQSLALRKPTMTEKHGGGYRFGADSVQYKMLRAWIAAGAPFGDKDAPALRLIEIAPAYRVLQSTGERQQLLVTALYSDGSREDVTRLAVYSSNDESILKVDGAGVVAPAGGNGDAPILVRYGGQVAVAVLGATMLPAPRAFPAAADNVVDREIYRKLRNLHIVPSEPATDEEFIRRAYLDIAGMLPAAADVRQFAASTAPDKRRYLIDQLLERPEYADLEALRWADRLRSDSRFHRIGGVRSYYRWLREEFAANRPLDKLASSLLTARGANFTVGPANYWGNYDKISTPKEVAIQTGQVFMGVRIGCAECHNHPFERWTQNDFYSLAAVFSQVVEFHTQNQRELELHREPSRAVLHPVSKK